MTDTRGSRIAVLDALRGLSALAIVLLHTATYLGGPALLPSAYLAVDLFFLISGFVNAEALARRGSGTAAVRTFLVARWRRLYPLYALGLGLGLLLELARASAAMDPAAAEIRTVQFALSLAFVPNFGSDMVVPLNPVFWSLILEAVAYVWHAVRLQTWSTPAIAALTGSAASVLGILAIRYGSLDLGSGPGEFLAGGVRAAFGYSAGVVLQRLSVAAALPRISLGAGLTVGTAAAVFATTVASEWRPVFDLVAVVTVFPVLVVAAIGTPAENDAVRWLARTGAWSYPLYALHVPVLFLVVPWLRQLVGDASLLAGLSGLAAVYVATLVGVVVVTAGLAPRAVCTEGSSRRTGRPA